MSHQPTRNSPSPFASECFLFPYIYNKFGCCPAEFLYRTNGKLPFPEFVVESVCISGFSIVHEQNRRWFWSEYKYPRISIPYHQAKFIYVIKNAINMTFLEIIKPALLMTNLLCHSPCLLVAAHPTALHMASRPGTSSKILHRVPSSQALGTHRIDPCFCKKTPR